MIDTETLRDLQDQAAHRNVEADHAVDAFLDAPPRRDLALWDVMADALILADDANRKLRQALETHKPSAVKV